MHTYVYVMMDLSLQFHFHSLMLDVGHALIAGGSKEVHVLWIHAQHTYTTSQRCTHFEASSFVNTPH